MAKVDLSDILDMSVEDRIVLAQQIWDSVASDPENVPLTDEQRQELEHRLEEYKRSPGNTVSWTVIERRLRSQMGK